MNLTTVALLFIAMQLLGGKNGKPSDKSKQSFNADSFRGILSDDTQSLIDSIGKLRDPDTPNEDKTGAILSMVTNPAVMNFASGLFGGANRQSPTSNETKPTPDVNDEGYAFESPSEDAREFFKPVENIAGTEASHKLYELYDNWYCKKRS
ncbi:MAG: hypothetical protein NC350_02520 [Corallococcus sp.]|nr:hypothetical protein [Corallococcus sp.]